MTHVIPLVDISVQPIELCKLLKIANMVGGGGEAKIVISEGYVLLNNEVEFQKRKKVYHNDIIEFNGETIQVNLVKANDNIQTAHKLTAADNTENSKPKKQKTLSTATKNSSKNQVKVVQKAEAVRTKRKPISF
ncbi:RNA-binding S4 domain-containing protein [Cognaticolwellia aestuarii]|jgi:ribosome-associated protein|uniref:RNA-binding S4 domain-containing protein n=1 Tax=Cognaticolwellia aestuarii TaxID=329993 RepID=UPI0009848AFE|nr:RNA-binding S4 domain-containing protein [Cognaticolwellia aestuarii]